MKFPGAPTEDIKYNGMLSCIWQCLKVMSFHSPLSKTSTPRVCKLLKLLPSYQLCCTFSFFLSSWATTANGSFEGFSLAKASFAISGHLPSSFNNFRLFFLDDQTQAKHVKPLGSRLHSSSAQETSKISSCIFWTDPKLQFNNKTHDLLSW